MMYATSFRPLPFSVPCSTSSRKQVKFPASYCLRTKTGDDPEVPQEIFLDSTTSEIWQLFNEAQQNILYLNKHRLLAAEALEKANRENELLANKIKEMEEALQAISREDKPAVMWEFIHRIDSMVLNGMISAKEAMNLRKSVVDLKSSLDECFVEYLQRSDNELLSALRRSAVCIEMKCFHVIHICSEMAPLVSVGSLASYVTGVAKALQRRGHLIEVILPKYKILDLTEVKKLRKVEAGFYSYFNGQLHENAVWTGVVQGIGITFIEPLHYASFFDRDDVYGYSDDFERFTYFSRASLDYVVKSGKLPDILHVHNCETAIVGPLFWDIFFEQGLQATRILLTCHRFDSQFLVHPNKLMLCGLDPTRLHRPDRLQDDNKIHLANILKGGIVYCNKVIIVSRSSLNGWLEPTIAIHKNKFVISPYGIDTFSWDPSIDKGIPTNYNLEDMKGKTRCKEVLQNHLALVQDPLASIVVSAVSGSESFDFGPLIAAVQFGVRNGSQFIFLNSKSTWKNKLYESLSTEIKNRLVSFLNDCDEAISHLLISGADILFCDTFDDPAHQLPMKALKYGAAPLILSNNMNELRNDRYPDRDSSKFLQFCNSTFGNMSFEEALYMIKNKPEKWEEKIAGAMAMDFSWDAQCGDILVHAYEAVTKM